MIRISRFVVLAAVAGLASPLSAQVTYRESCSYNREQCEAMALQRAREAEARAMRLADERWAREQEARFRADYQRERSRGASRDQQVRVREQQSRVYEQQERIRVQALERSRAAIERSREYHQRDLERAQEQRERALERAAELRERELERASEMRERLLQNARELQEREIGRTQSLRDAAERRRDYIAPPPGVRLRSRWPS